MPSSPPTACLCWMKAHERSLNTDILFGLLKGLVQRRRAPRGWEQHSGGGGGWSRCCAVAAVCHGRAGLPRHSAHPCERPTLVPQGEAAEAGGHVGHAGRREVQQILSRLPRVPRARPRHPGALCCAVLRSCRIRCGTPLAHGPGVRSCAPPHPRPAPHPCRLPTAALQVPGRTFPVDVIHSLEDHTQEYLAAAVDTAIDIHCNQPEGGCSARRVGRPRPCSPPLRASQAAPVYAGLSERVWPHTGAHPPACTGNHACVALHPHPPGPQATSSCSSRGRPKSTRPPSS